MSDNPKFQRADAIAVARAIGGALKPACDRVIVAGSLRRGCPKVGDVEIVYIPRREIQQSSSDFFQKQEVNLADQVIARLEGEGVLERRKNVHGSTTFGEKNKLMVHVASGIGVDLFSTTAENWFNYLVCRTGPAESNARIATMAKRREWHWNPYGSGFARDGRIGHMASEKAVFEFSGLKWPGARTEIAL